MSTNLFKDWNKINFYLKNNSINAKARFDFNNEKFTIFKNSKFLKENYSEKLLEEKIKFINLKENIKGTTKNNYLKCLKKVKNIFEFLCQKQIIILQNNYYFFKNNYTFDNKTIPTMFLFGYLKHERIHYENFWKDKNNNKLKYYLNVFKKEPKILNNTEEKQYKDLDEINVSYKESIKKYKFRINQSLLREKLLEKYNKKCLFSNIDIVDVLEVAHIKSVSDYDDEEKINDIKNSILISCFFHKLLDRGLISFDENYNIIFSSKLSKDQIKIIKNYIKNKEYSKILRKNIDFKYIEYHRKNIFKN